MPAIVTLTMNPALDVATATDAIVPSTKLRCEEPRYDPGGGGINVARAVHMLGGDALAVYPAGGASGEMIRGFLEKEGVPQAVVPVASMTRQGLAVVERQSGKQYRFLLPGPPLGAHDRERCLDALAAQAKGAVFIVASGSLPPGAPDDFNLRTPEELLQAQEETSRTFTILLAGIASVSLIVGGIGIMNIMLVTVVERTREIGVRRAIGATRRDIRSQFLLETSMLTIMSGAAGIVLGIISSFVFSRVLGWPTIIPPSAIVLSFIFSAVLGIFFGFYPARQAALLNPIEALRWE